VLRIVPISLKDANAYVARHHRHHKPVPGCKFAIGCRVLGVDEGVGADPVLDVDFSGVCIVGRPVSRHLDDGRTLELTRMCTDGTRNACSMLYGAAWRAAKALGYEKLITYTLPEEGGASLRASGWRLLGVRGGGSWSRPSRPRIDKHPLQQKHLWEAALNA
jgi:hypothetical protein